MKKKILIITNRKFVTLIFYRNQFVAYMGSAFEDKSLLELTMKMMSLKVLPIYSSK